MDRPGQRARPGARALGRPPDRLRRRRAHRDRQAGGPAGRAARAARRTRRRSSTSWSDHLRPHGKRQPLVVHRIDRDTSGLVVFAKHAAAQHRLKEQFKRHDGRARLPGRRVRPSRPAVRHVARSARVGSEGAHSEGNASRAIRRARTRCVTTRCSSDSRRRRSSRSASRRGSATRFGCRPGCAGTRSSASGGTSTGRTNFGRSSSNGRRCTRYRLAFVHPVTGEPLRFEAPIPADLTELLERLRSQT